MGRGGFRGIIRCSGASGDSGTKRRVMEALEAATTVLETTSVVEAKAVAMEASTALQEETEVVDSGAVEGFEQSRQCRQRRIRLK